MNSSVSSTNVRTFFSLNLSIYMDTPHYRTRDRRDSVVSLGVAVISLSGLVSTRPAETRKVRTCSTVYPIARTNGAIDSAVRRD